MGGIAGFGSGLTGVGGPALSVPLMVLFGFPALVSIGASQVLQIVAAVSGTLGNLRFGSIDFGVAATVTLIELAGVMVGVRLAHAVDGAVLRKVVAVLCLVVGTALVIRELGGLQLTSAFASWLAGRCKGQIEFAPGIATPLSFGDPHREHLATRRAGGLFDFSFMGCTDINGPGALACVNALQTRRLDTLRPGRIAYTLLLREYGSVLNDATVWRLGWDRFWVFTGRRADGRYIAQFGTAFHVEIVGSGTQRRRSSRSRATSADARSSGASRESSSPRLPYFGFRASDVRRHAECWIARLGYSGETGYELVIADAAAAALWQALLDAGSGRRASSNADSTPSTRSESRPVTSCSRASSPRP